MLLLVIANVGFSLVLLAVMHRLIHFGVRGDMFVANALRMMGYFAAVLIAQAIAEPVLINLVKYYLTFTGDVPKYSLLFTFDPVEFAGGILTWALCFILKQGMGLQEEQKLTI
jgi:hypothetical protein